MNDRPQQRDNHGSLDNDPLTSAIDALAGTPINEPAHRSVAISSIADIIQNRITSPVLLRTDSDSNSEGITFSHQGRKTRMVRIFRLSGLAATIMILAVGVVIFSQLNRNTAFAFEQTVEKIKKSTSASYSFTITSENYKLDHGKKKLVQKSAIHQQVYNQGDLVRVDCLSIPGTKTITRGLCIGCAYPVNGAPSIEPQPVKTEATLFFDHQLRKAVFLMHVNKEAYQDEISKSNEENAEQEFGQYSAEGMKNNITKIITGDSKNKPERIADEMVNGKNTRVFKVKRSDQSTELVDSGKVWIDIDTGLPVKLEAEGVRSNPDGSEEKNYIVMEDFKWNEAFTTSLFDASIPQGFKVLKQNVTDKTVISQTPDLLRLFTKSVEQVRKASSVRFTMTQFSKKPNGTEVRVEDRYQCLKTKGHHETHVANDKGKMYFTKLILIDGEERLDIDHVDKTAKKQANQLDDLVTDMIQGFADLDGAEFAGIEKLNGIAVHRYHFAKIKDVTNSKSPIDYLFDKDEYYRTWIDPITRLPVRVEMKMRTSDGYLQPISIENFEWNVPLDEKLFKLEVPAGYKLIGAEPDSKTKGNK